MCRRFDTNFGVLISCRSIERSRKRKLRELFEVATVDDIASNDKPTDIDASPSTPALAKFFYNTDILRYVSSVQDIRVFGNVVLHSRFL